MTFWVKTPTHIIAQIQLKITGAGMTCDYTPISLSSAVDLFRSLIFVVDVFTYAFAIMISLIAVASVFNIISTNIWLRHRELVMLRSAGMSAHGFNHMVNSECFFYGLRTLLFGVPLATAFSWLIYKGIVFSQQLRISLITSHWQV